MTHNKAFKLFSKNITEFFVFLYICIRFPKAFNQNKFTLFQIKKKTANYFFLIFFSKTFCPNQNC